MKKNVELVALFLELAKPNQKGFSRWVSVTEFVGKYQGLVLGNGLSWGRRGSTLAKKYIIEVDRKQTRGNKIDRIRLNGFNKEKGFNQAIRQDILKKLSQQKCVMLGVVGESENTRIEVDHKNGRKDDERVSNPKTQQESDFQPLCKAANDIKRQICKKCKATNIRWSAKNIKGNPYPFYEGDEHYKKPLGCVGCYQYDPVEYRIRSVEMVMKDTMKKLYGDDPEIMQRLDKNNYPKKRK